MPKTKLDIAFEISEIAEKYGLVVFIFAGKSLMRLRKKQLQELREVVGRFRGMKRVRKALEYFDLNVSDTNGE